MNALERELKLKQKIANDLKIIKLKTEQRKINEQRLEENLGIQKYLYDFHKPITEKLEEQEIARQENVKSITDAIKNITPSIDYTQSIDYSPDAGKMIDQVEGYIRLNFNKELDTNFIKELKYELPTELINKSDEQLDEIILSAKSKRDEYKRLKANATKNKYEDKIRDSDYKMKQMKTYIKAIETLKTGNYYIGEGCEKNIELLDKLTDKPLTKKIYNQIVMLLDILLRKGDITNEFVKEYYHKFLS